ncbi:hypothetical protein [Flammeovirga sp. EKP202]|nr:hypothetical protein [Flammeovirga sp. EKP202]MBD0405320.1 hypothetical protein [Flammeovirga sp. EKP202]
MPAKQTQKPSDDKEELLKLIEVRKKEIDVLRKLYKKFASSSNSFK